MDDLNLDLNDRRTDLNDIHPITMRILSWNINGIRSFETEAAAATANKQQLSSGWMEAVSQCDPDIVAVQETKITRKCLPVSSIF